MQVTSGFGAFTIGRDLLAEAKKRYQRHIKELDKEPREHPLEVSKVDWVLEEEEPQNPPEWLGDQILLGVYRNMQETPYGEHPLPRGRITLFTKNITRFSHALVAKAIRAGLDVTAAQRKAMEAWFFESALQCVYFHELCHHIVDVMQKEQSFDRDSSWEEPVAEAFSLHKFFTDSHKLPSAKGTGLKPRTLKNLFAMLYFSSNESPYSGFVNRVSQGSEPENEDLMEDFDDPYSDVLYRPDRDGKSMSPIRVAEDLWKANMHNPGFEAGYRQAHLIHERMVNFPPTQHGVAVRLA